MAARCRKRCVNCVSSGNKQIKAAHRNHALWKKFDEACNAAHKVVEAWLDKIRSEAAEHKAQRLALIERSRHGPQEHAASGDWKGIHRALYQFGDRWRESGHVGEKLFAELQPCGSRRLLLPLLLWKLRRRKAWRDAMP